MEIERKFLLRSLPPELDAAPARVIIQGYLALTQEGVEVRVRRKDDKTFLTVKHGADLTRTEVELPLPADGWDALWPLTAGRRLRKTRRELPGPDGRPAQPSGSVITASSIGSTATRSPTSPISTATATCWR